MSCTCKPRRYNWLERGDGEIWVFLNYRRFTKHGEVILCSLETEFCSNGFKSTDLRGKQAVQTDACK